VTNFKEPLRLGVTLVHATVQFSLLYTTLKQKWVAELASHDIGNLTINLSISGFTCVFIFDSGGGAVRTLLPRPTEMAIHPLWVPQDMNDSY